MIKIAICDDEMSVLEELSALLENYRTERNYEMEYTAYQSPLELMAGMERGLHWDILLLDIMMPGQNGIELATEIRNFDTKTKIIFLTSSPEFAVESYTVEAYFYQLKPITSDTLFPVLDRAFETCQKTQHEKLILKCKSGITAVAPEDLEYCEVISHTLLLHLQDGQILESVGRLDDIERNLYPLGCFLRVHRSYLVNMSYIQRISYRSITLNCLVEIPIPHGKYNETKKAYLAYAFEKERVLI